MERICFRLTGDAIASAAPFPPAARAGAVATFEGWVRSHNQGKPVVSLEYTCYARLAQAEGERILAEAVDTFGLLRADCVHRLGRLVVGDCAVKVWVAAEHRREAFAGCAYVIDQIKHRVPIWKKEMYAGGDSEWVECSEEHLVASSSPT